MAVAVKSAAFAMLLRVLLVGFGDERLIELGQPAGRRSLAALAVLTMTVANLVAGRQESVKRMLAYSSIAHAGYVLVGVVATMRCAPEAQASVLFYLLTYTVSTAGAFGALILCGRRGAEAVELRGPRRASAGATRRRRSRSRSSCCRSRASRRPRASSASSTCSAPPSTPGSTRSR